MDDLLTDAVRELEKDLELLLNVDRMMAAEAHMNAAKHLSSDVLPAPLASKVMGRTATLAEAIARLRARQQTLDFEEEMMALSPGGSA